MTQTPPPGPVATRPRRRVSLTRVLVLIIAIAAVGWFGYRAVVAAVVAPQEPGPSIFSPYVDATAWPPFAFESPPGAAQSDVTLAFVVADPDDECAPSWGGYYSLDEASSAIELDRRIRQLRNVGGDVRVSFGGAINSELATVCESEGRLVDAYRDVVERYELTTIDLDIEGSALSDTAANARRATAIAALQQEVTAAGAELNVWITVPVGTTGLTPEGERLYADMLDAGVDVAGVNGMAMNLGVPTTASSPQAEGIVQALTAVHGQVVTQLRRAGFGVSDTDAWGLIGVTVMIGQNDTATERFTINDAEAINTFAREHGVGLVSMWSLNRDAPCVAPVPTESTVVQDNCSGVDQQGQKFSDVLAKDLVKPLPQGKPTPLATPSESPSPVPMLAPGDIVDDPATSPYPIWDPLGTYPGGTKIVWRHNVYEARYWNTGFAPDTPVGNPYDSPWTLLGPVLPGDKPAPLPTLPEGTYPAWDAEKAYVAGDRVQLGTVPYEAKWWSQGTEPGTNVPGGSPWVLIFPAQ